MRKIPGFAGACRPCGLTTSAGTALESVRKTDLGPLARRPGGDSLRR